MRIRKRLLSPCGLYCGVCAIYIAHQEKDNRLKRILAAAYDVEAEDIHCRGCLSDKPFGYCQVCAIRSCAQKKGLSGCHRCAKFPCKRIKKFPIDTGRRVMLRAVPRRREVGKQRWVKEEVARYRCPECGYALFRGARRCRNCRARVNPDVLG